MRLLSDYYTVRTLRMVHEPAPKTPSLTRARIAMLFAYLLILTAILAALALLPAAVAEPIPEGGPQLAGSVAPDGTLFVPWYFGTSSARFLRDGDTFPAEYLHVIAYAPNANTTEGQLRLNFRWEAPVVVTKQVVEGEEVRTVEETIWNQTLERDYYVGAHSKGTENTEIQLPTRHAERLTVTYSGSAKGRDFEMNILQVTHDTSVAYAKLARPTLESNYIDSLQVGAALLVLGIAGASLFRRLYKRAGGYSPKVEIVALSFVLAFLVGIVAFLVWPRHREGILLKGFGPLLFAYTILAGFVSMQIWREATHWWQMKRYHPIIDARNPQLHMWHVDVPARLHDPHPLTDNPRDVAYVDDDWKSWIFRAVFGARTYLRFPDRDWWYEVTNSATAVEREHLLEAPMPMARCARCVELGYKDVKTRPHLSWDPAEETAKLQWLPRLRVHRLIIREVPLSPKAYDKAVTKVLAGIVSAEAVGKELHELEQQVAQLEADVNAGRNQRVRAFVNELFLAEESALTGTSLKDLRPKQSGEQEITDPVGAAAPEDIVVTVSRPANGSKPHAKGEESDDA